MVYKRFIEHHVKMTRLGEFLMTLFHVILLVVNERTVEHDVKIIYDGLNLLCCILGENMSFWGSS